MFSTLLASRAEPGHFYGRERKHIQGARSRRPRTYVWICNKRNTRIDAPANHNRASAVNEARTSKKEKRARLGPARRQVPGVCCHFYAALSGHQYEPAT